MLCAVALHAAAAMAAAVLLRCKATRHAKPACALLLTVLLVSCILLQAHDFPCVIVPLACILAYPRLSMMLKPSGVGGRHCAACLAPTVPSCSLFNNIFQFHRL